MQFVISLLSLLVFVTLIWGTNTSFNSSSLPLLQRKRRIVGGEPNIVQNTPYIVNIRKRRFFECAGTLITPKCVLTAAHCVDETRPQDLVVRAGVTYLTDYRNTRHVQQIHIPDTYNKLTLDNDMAILQLGKSLRKGPNIDTIQLAHVRPTAGTFLLVTGWGLTHSEAQQPTQQMHSVYVPILNDDKCKTLYQGYRNITQSMFCASMPDLKDACSADSGGPAVAKGRLVGIVSWGKGNQCAVAEAPGVYVNIANVRQWIRQTMRKNCY